MNFVNLRSMIGRLLSDRGRKPSSKGRDDGPALIVGSSGAIVRGRKRISDSLAGDGDGVAAGVRRAGSRRELDDALGE